MSVKREERIEKTRKLIESVTPEMVYDTVKEHNVCMHTYVGSYWRGCRRESVYIKGSSLSHNRMYVGAGGIERWLHNDKPIIDGILEIREDFRISNNRILQYPEEIGEKFISMFLSDTNGCVRWKLNHENSLFFDSLLPSDSFSADLSEKIRKLELKSIDISEKIRELQKQKDSLERKIREGKMHQEIRNQLYKK